MILQIDAPRPATEEEKNYIKKFISDYLNRNTDTVTPEKIIETVYGYMRCNPALIGSKCRESKTIVRPRQVVVYFMKKLLGEEMSLNDIGLVCGNKHHSTVLHACRVVENLMFSDPVFRKTIEEIAKLLTK